MGGRGKVSPSSVFYSKIVTVINYTIRQRWWRFVLPLLFFLSLYITRETILSDELQPMLHANFAHFVLPLLRMYVISAHKRSCGKVMFSQASVCAQGVGVGNIKCIMGEVRW